jgi:hypothetical protein
MSVEATCIRAALAVPLVLLASTAVFGQGLFVDLAAGRVVFDPVPGSMATSNATGTLRFETPRGLSLYGTAAAPLNREASIWGAFGGEGRLTLAGNRNAGAHLGVDVGAHGYLFRDVVLDQSGRGGTVAAVPFAALSSGGARVEVRGGWRGQTLSYAGIAERRGVLETGVRAGYGTVLKVEGEARWVRAPEGTFPFAGASLVYAGTPVQAWVQGGKWASADLDEFAWEAGVGVSVNRDTTFWASAQQRPPDPLYWNVMRRSWSVGMTRRFGPPAVALPSAPPRQDGNGVLIRLAAEAGVTDVSIAGDFNGWQPLPMQRDGQHWFIRLPLAPGVYHYAFRSSDGRWFVPSDVAGRRSDGMGGYVAVIVVS